MELPRVVLRGARLVVSDLADARVGRLLHDASAYSSAAGDHIPVTAVADAGSRCILLPVRGGLIGRVGGLCLRRGRFPGLRLGRAGPAPLRPLRSWDSARSATAGGRAAYAAAPARAGASSSGR